MVASDPVSGDNLLSVDMEFVKPRFLVVPEIQSSIHSSFCREGFLCVVLENPVAGGDGVTEEVRVRNFKFNFKLCLLLAASLAASSTISFPWIPL